MDGDSTQSLRDIAAALGVTWKRSRKRLPPSSNAKFVELVFDLRSHILPKEELCIDENLQGSRPDIRLLGGCLSKLATRGGSHGEDLDEKFRAVDQDRRSRWCDLDEDEVEECEGHCAVGESAVGKEEKEAQTEADMTNMKMVIGPEGLFGVVEQTACHCLMLELQSLVPVGLDEYECRMGDYIPLEVSDTAVDLEGGLEDSLGKFGEQVRYNMNTVCDMQRGIISNLAKVGDLLDEALKIDGCVACGFQQEEASSGLFFFTEPPDGCELRELRESQDRISLLMGSMCTAACEHLPGTRSVDSEFLSFGPPRKCQDPGDSSTLVVEASPQWADTPTAVMEKAAAIRSAPPEYLAGFEEQELDDYDVILNEIFARPSSKTTYIAALQEVHCLCGDHVDDVCGLLTIPMTWLELKRAIVARVMKLDGECSLLDVISEIRSEM
mmetsp:Transcript_24998/g.74400  ORF Transcript_24998/g.74400 Transcript_24998/m.74400 type:complete len:440 (+) Transcript_24998:123-1442(+)